MRSMVRSVLPVRAANSGAVRNPSSHATWRALSSKPILVGETRGASGNPFPSHCRGSGNCGARRQIRGSSARCAARARSRKSRSLLSMGRWPRGGRLSQMVMGLASAHNKRMGAAQRIAQRCAANSQISTPRQHRNKRRNGEIPVNMRTSRRLQFRLRGAFPLQQALARNESPDQRANDGIECEQSFVRQKDKTDQNHESRAPKTGRSPPWPVPCVSPMNARAKRKRKLSDGGEEQQQQGGDGPIQRSARQAKPARDEESEDRWLDQRTAEVVEDFPARNAGDGIGGPTA